MASGKRPLRFGVLEHAEVAKEGVTGRDPDGAGELAVCERE